MHDFFHEPLQTFAPSGMSDFFDWRPGMNHISRVQHFTQIDGSFNPTMKCLLPVFPQLTEAERTRGMFVLVPPTLAIAIVPDEIAYFIIRPQGANAITIDIGYCFHPSALKVPLFKHLQAGTVALVHSPVFLTRINPLTYAVAALRYVVFAAQEVPPAAAARFPSGLEVLGHTLTVGQELAVVVVVATAFLVAAIRAFGVPE